GSGPQPAVRIGDQALPLAPLTNRLLSQRAGLFASASLDAFLGAGPQVWAEVRTALTEWLTDPGYRSQLEPDLLPLAECPTVLPFTVADYVDFYASEHHAGNVGQIFRPGQPPLTPNWKHLPIGYHCRSGTVVVSGTGERRPDGQRKVGDASECGPSLRLDMEAELGFVVGVGADHPIPVADFAEHVFGVVLLNDWSARDIQAWEYVPLGPFLGKSFATSVSPWVVPLDALDAARIPVPGQDPTPLPYLRGRADTFGFDLSLEVRINDTLVAEPPYADMCWSPAQMLAHMTVNGASLRTGDVFASGTVSGPAAGQRGSLLELTWNGTEPITLTDGTT